MGFPAWKVKEHFCVENTLMANSPFNAEDETGTCEKLKNSSVETPFRGRRLAI